MTASLWLPTCDCGRNRHRIFTAERPLVFPCRMTNHTHLQIDMQTTLTQLIGAGLHMVDLQCPYCAREGVPDG